MDKEIKELLELFSKKVSVEMNNRFNKDYEKHRKFVKDFFNIKLPKKNKI